MTGSQWRVKAEHPRRPGQPLRLTDKAGHVLATSGDLCTSISPAHLASFIRNGFVEPVPAEPAARPRRRPTAAEGEA